MASMCRTRRVHARTPIQHQLACRAACKIYRCGRFPCGRRGMPSDALPKVQAPRLLIVGGNDDIVIELNKMARLAHVLADPRFAAAFGGISLAHGKKSSRLKPVERQAFLALEQ